MVNTLGKIGIMQGRLTRPKGRGIQFFPFDNWENEFRIASKIGISEIDFIFDYENYQQNPLWNSPSAPSLGKEGVGGVQKIKALIAETGVVVNYICADFFMRRPLAQNVKVLERMILTAKEIGARGIEIPLVDNSSIKTPEEEGLFVASLKEVLPQAKAHNIAINLETDYPPQKLLKLLERLANPMMKITYDSGNSASLGFDPYEEITTYGKYVTSIHIKDRILGGTTVALGTGDADFDKLFRALKEVNYAGNYILQAARGPEGQEENTIKSQMDFVKRYL